MSNNETLDPEIADLVSAAFAKSWQFVRTDPELAHDDMDAMRIRLAWHLESLAKYGERDLWRLANGAIGKLRRERRVSNQISYPSSPPRPQPDAPSPRRTLVLARNDQRTTFARRHVEMHSRADHKRGARRSAL
jgi:hypothetical protein